MVFSGAVTTNRMGAGTRLAAVQQTEPTAGQQRRGARRAAATHHNRPARRVAAAKGCMVFLRDFLWHRTRQRNGRGCKPTSRTGRSAAAAIVSGAGTSRTQPRTGTRACGSSRCTSGCPTRRPALCGGPPRSASGCPRRRSCRARSASSTRPSRRRGRRGSRAPGAGRRLSASARRLRRRGTAAGGANRGGTGRTRNSRPPGLRGSPETRWRFFIPGKGRNIPSRH